MAHNLFSRWRYSTRLLFSGCDQAVYQQDLVVHRTAGRDYEETTGAGLNTLKVWHVFIGSKCRPDYGDLRFTDRYGQDLAYYIWPGYDAASAQVCVRLEGADRDGVLAIHYGNAAATTTSDGDAVGYCDAFSEIGAAWDVSGVATASIDAGRLKTTGIANTWTSYTTAAVVRNVAVSGPFIATVNLDYAEGPLCLGKLYFTVCTASSRSSIGYQDTNLDASGGLTYVLNGGSEVFSGKDSRPASGSMALMIIRDSSDVMRVYENGVLNGTGTMSGDLTKIALTNIRFQNYNGNVAYWDNLCIRAYSATPPSLLRASPGVNPSYAGLARPLPGDSVIQFAGVGDIQVIGDERYAVSGAGAFTIETLVRSPITIAGTAGMRAGINLAPVPAALAGLGGIASDPARMRTPLDIEAGEGFAYVAPAPVKFDVWQYRFESLDISRSAQDALWRCDGQIDGLKAPLAYKSFTVRVPDHNGVLRTIFFGFVPGRDYVQAVAADKSTVQGFDAGFYLTRQYLPDGDLYYPAEFLWTPANLIKYWLGKEATWGGSPSYWERTTGIMPYRIHDPISYGHSYTPKDWNFQPLTTKIQAIQEVCEYSGMVFLVKWRVINGAMTPCAYLVHQDDIDHATHGLDLPPMVTFTHPDPRIANGVRATLQSDEKYNRIEVRSASPSGAWFHAVRETVALQRGEELPIEYLEERSDLPIDADHGGWCSARADELYAYYTAYSYTYTLTLINRTDLELYQRCRFYGFGAIPDGGIMRIVAIRYNVRPTHTEVEITVTPDSRLSDLRRLQRSQAADSVSEIQTIARGQIDQIAAGEVGTVVGIDGAEAIVELERRADSSVRGRIV